MNQTLSQPQIIANNTNRSLPISNFTIRYLLRLYFLPILILIAVAVFSMYAHIPVGNLMRDPSAIVELHSYEGIVSNFGALTWCAAATICLFAGMILRRTKQTPDKANYLLLAGLFSTVLLLDDFFLGHEKLEAIGIPEQITYLGYALFWTTVVVRYREIILRSNFLLLLIGLAFFGYSIGSDMAEGQIERFIGEWRVFFEDGSKFLGIVGWLGYFARFSFIEVEKALF